jgi:hypothetical protein
MKKNILKLGIALLAIASITLQSCSKSPNDSNSDLQTIESTDLSEVSQTESDAVLDDVPSLDLGGETFSILHRDYMTYETYAESQNGEFVNDAVYARNRAVEERLNIKFNMIPMPGAWAHKDQFLDRVRNSVSAGDNEFDMISGYAAYMVELTNNNYLHNWNEIPFIGFDKPWWNKEFIEEMTINDKLYFLTGDLALSLIADANVLFFNKDMWADYSLEDPYKIVSDGKWTFDKMAEFTTQVSSDVNGDGTLNEEDMYGYVTDMHNQLDAYFAAFEIPVTLKGTDGLPEIAVKSERFITGFEKLYAFMRKTESTFAGSEQPATTDIYSMYRPIFQNQRALIIAEYLGNSSQMRDYDFDFGILPFPKWNEAQKDYKTMSQDGYTMFCVPATVSDTEKVGAVVESLASESYKSVLPTFYEVALKTKYARDEESEQMIDIIREGISFNFGIIEVVPLERPHHVWRILMINNQDSIASEVEKNFSVYQNSLDKILATYED